MSPMTGGSLPDLSVDDNLEITYRRNDEWSKDRVYDLFPALREIKDRRSGNLSGGEQQMLTIGRSLMTAPSCSCSMSRRKGSPR